MKKILFPILSLTLMSSCATPIAATSNAVGDVEGKACARNILGIIPLSLDASIYTAAKNAGIRQISTVDRDMLITFVYNEVCTTVHGSK